VRGSSCSGDCCRRSWWPFSGATCLRCRRVRRVRGDLFVWSFAHGVGSERQMVESGMRLHGCRSRRSVCGSAASSNNRTGADEQWVTGCSCAAKRKNGGRQTEAKLRKSGEERRRMRGKASEDGRAQRRGPSETMGGECLMQRTQSKGRMSKGAWRAHHASSCSRRCRGSASEKWATDTEEPPAAVEDTRGEGERGIIMGRRRPNIIVSGGQCTRR
jgi:hypothetical protein